MKHLNSRTRVGPTTPQHHLPRSKRPTILTVVMILLAAVCSPEARANDDAPPIPSEELRSRFVAAEHETMDPATWLAESQSREIHDEYDVIHYDVDLSFDIDAKIVFGTVEIEGESSTAGLTEVVLDLYDPMVVDAVLIDGSPATYVHSGGFLTVQLGSAHSVGEPFTVTCTYHGTPSFSLAPFRWRTQNSVPMILSYSEPFGAPAWWVCKDDPTDKATFSIHLTVEDTLSAVSNGLLISVDNPGSGGAGTETYNWATNYPMSTYLFSIAITNFVEWTEVYTALDGITTMDVNYHVYPADLADAQVSWSRNLEMMDYYASIFGEYPFLDERYGIAEFAHGGAMEHQTCTSMGAGWINGSHSNDFVVAHELAHAWVGDMISSDWDHAWCKEGFATYCEALYFEDSISEAYYHNYMASMNILAYADRQLFDIEPPLHAAIYYKGAWVLHMLRHVLGDAAFFDAIYAYTNDPDLRYSIADSEDMRDVFAASSGVGLDWFFDEWVYNGFHPEYQVGWGSVADGDGYAVSLVIAQVQPEGPMFKMPIDIRITTDEGVENFVVWDSTEVQSFTLTTSGMPLDLELDPDDWIIKESTPASTPEDGPVVDVSTGLQLYPSQPNPTSGATSIEFVIPTQTEGASARVGLAIYNSSGRVIVELISGEIESGLHRVEWDGEDRSGKTVPAGIYWSRLESDGLVTSSRVVVVR